MVVSRDCEGAKGSYYSAGIKSQLYKIDKYNFLPVVNNSVLCS